jgi:tetratricopeptide (TPR) repeat protein
LGSVEASKSLLADAGDRMRLEVAVAAAGVIANPTSEGAASRLSKLVASPKLKGAAWAQARDAGAAYVAYSLLKRKQYDECIKQLKRVTDPLGGVVKRMRMAAVDAKARAAFDQTRYKAAADLWKEVEDPSPAIKVNLGAALFASGNTAAKSYWSPQGPAEALYNLAIAADREGRYEEAYELFGKYVKRGGSKAKRASARIKAKQRVFGWK